MIIKNHLIIYLYNNLYNNLIIYNLFNLYNLYNNLII